MPILQFCVDIFYDTVRLLWGSGNQAEGFLVSDCGYEPVSECL